ncbi:ABC transporter ATP-binding protein [Thomasclavelia spiroformis]|uniref:ABC transporter ATP-binding protein n=1 Tax=Thomasclavelia spiroformis TaxID=29348 RepID=UPI000B391620|nr:ABC transporter ATP-binding protein [Thomasclavelia spiroformis]OUO65752.1 ABC transporter [Thomasclavelia spiroformis]
MNKDQVKTLKRLFNFVLTRHRNSCIVVLLLIIVSTIANVSGSIFIKSLIDDYITPYINSANPNFAPLLNAIIRMIAIYAIGVLATYGFNRILINVSQGSLKEIRDSMFEHMEKLPIRYFDTHNHGDIMSIYTNDADTLRQMISQSVPQVIVSGITILSVFVSMIIISLPLTCISVFMVIVMLFVSKHVTSRSGKYFYQQQINLGKVNGFIEEMMEGQKVVKVFTHEEEAKKDFDKVNEELFESAYEANKYANILMPLIGNLGYVSYVLVALIGGVLAINGYTNLSIGALASFLQLNRSFNNPIGQISQQVNMVLMALAGASRIFALLDEEVEKDEGHVTLVNAKENEDGTLSPVDYRTGVWAWEHRRPDGSIEYVRLVGDVRFHDVTFGYNENKTILYDMNLFAKPGEKLAFVGATGAGKTTITNLINRFYDIQKGSITYDGIDIKLIKKADLRRSLGIVLQDTHLFTGTIMDNIRYGKLDATDEECIAAAKLANAHEFIMHLEHGYQTVLSGDGSSLSQGQCQLLAIARAAVANPPVLILDEATSSIDTRTESIVQSGMDKLMEGRTVFVIAHRLSTIKNSDAIMVLDQGRIIERGDHDKLIGQKGTYYQLYTGGLELD